MIDPDAFDLKDFTPYLLASAAETASLQFQTAYKERYGMLRTEWRVVFHLGRYGPMTAKQICARARIHKTKVSRAVSALGQKTFLTRNTVDADRRSELLELTKTGRAAFDDLYGSARQFDAKLMADFSSQEREVLRRCLKKIAGI